MYHNCYWVKFWILSLLIYFKNYIYAIGPSGSSERHLEWEKIQEVKWKKEQKHNRKYITSNVDIESIYISSNNIKKY